MEPPKMEPPPQNAMDRAHAAAAGVADRVAQIQQRQTQAENSDGWKTMGSSDSWGAARTEAPQAEQWNAAGGASDPLASFYSEREATPQQRWSPEEAQAAPQERWQSAAPQEQWQSAAPQEQWQPKQSPAAPQESWSPEQAQAAPQERWQPAAPQEQWQSAAPQEPSKWDQPPAGVTAASAACFGGFPAKAPPSQMLGASRATGKAPPLSPSGGCGGGIRPGITLGALGGGSGLRPVATSPGGTAPGGGLRPVMTSPGGGIRPGITLGQSPRPLAMSLNRLGQQPPSGGRPPAALTGVKPHLTLGQARTGNALTG